MKLTAKYKNRYLKVQILVNIEKQIIKRMEDYGYTRLDAIASMNWGKK